MRTMADVHPTAIVDERAELGEGVEVGPWCMVNGPVTIGPGTRLLHQVTLQGPLSIGEDNVLYPGVAIGYAPQDRKFDPDHDGAGVTIGDRNILRESVTIHRATGELPTSLGSDGYLMANSHVAHDCRVGDDVMFANGALLAGHVEIGDRVILGGNAVIHQFVRIGRLAMVSGLAGTGKDIPPFCICYIPRRIGSLNIVGLRRAGLRDHIRPLQKAFDTFFRGRLPNAAAVDRVAEQNGDDPMVAEFVAFIRASRRGITRYDRKTRGEEAPADASGR